MVHLPLRIGAAGDKCCENLQSGRFAHGRRWQYDILSCKICGQTDRAIISIGFSAEEAIVS